jgi:hypothetical protein
MSRKLIIIFISILVLCVIACCICFNLNNRVGVNYDFSVSNSSGMRLQVKAYCLDDDFLWTDLSNIEPYETRLGTISLRDSNPHCVLLVIYKASAMNSSPRLGIRLFSFPPPQYYQESESEFLWKNGYNIEIAEGHLATFIKDDTSAADNQDQDVRIRILRLALNILEASFSESSK